MFEVADSTLFALFCGIAAVAFMVWKARDVLQEDDGNDTMREIAAAIQEGAAAFLNREYTFLGVFVIVIALLITFARLAGKRPFALSLARWLPARRATWACTSPCAPTCARRRRRSAA